MAGSDSIEPAQSNVLRAVAETKATQQDEQVAALEGLLTAEKDHRKEERFLWILALIILVDLWMFPSMQSWGAPIAILVLELLLLVFIANRLGIEEVSILLNKVLGILGNGR